MPEGRLLANMGVARCNRAKPHILCCTLLKAPIRLTAKNYFRFNLAKSSPIKEPIIGNVHKATNPAIIHPLPEHRVSNSMALAKIFQNQSMAGIVKVKEEKKALKNVPAKNPMVA